jgi:hypothetical protein
VLDLISQLLERPLTSRLRARVLGPNRFDCGVRVVAGSVPGEGRRWRHRASRIDGDFLQHGRRATLLLRVQREIPNPGGWNLVDECIVFEAEELKYGAGLQLACLPNARAEVARLPHL